MKKVTAFIGSAHRKNTHKAVVLFLNDLQQLGEVNCEIVTLSDYSLKPCRGCEACIWKGEQFCQLKDDRDQLMDKIAASDGIVLASPVYSGHVSSLMKTFIDHFAFVCHRPRYFGKVCTSIVTYSIARGSTIVEYLDVFAMTLGFNVIKGTSLQSDVLNSESIPPKAAKDRARQVRQFYAGLMSPTLQPPKLMMVMIFQMWRKTIRQKFGPSSPDYKYYLEKGWFDSDYYYPTRLGLFKKAAGMLFERFA
jgi:multimeric flavodoxin WrbA